VIAAVVLLLACCQGSEGGLKSVDWDSVTRAEVELDIFSGRPNPAWSLSEAERSRLEEILSGLPGGEDRELPEPLGYRGFAATLTHTDARVTRIRVYKGVVRVEARGEMTALADPGRTLERWLATTGSRLDPGIREMILNELQND
jgi:hypothetical protein